MRKMELTHDGKRYKLITTPAVDSISFEDFSEDGTKCIIDCRTVKPEDIICKLPSLCQLIQETNVSYTWLNCSWAKFLEIKGRLLTLLTENSDMSALSRDLTILKLTKHDQAVSEAEALKISSDILLFGKNLLDIHRLMDAHPGLLNEKFHLGNSLKRKRQDRGVTATNPDSLGVVTVMPAPCRDKRRPGKRVFKMLKKMVTEDSADLNQAHCYMCRSKGSFGSLCDGCHKLNGEMKRASCDLQGRYAIVTGGRIKIGLETSLRLLRDGCFVIVTTRFPVDAAKRYSEEKDFDVWKHRLRIVHLDLQNMASIEEFLEYVQQNIPHLDILINNAAQTIFRPYQYYHSLVADEVNHLPGLSKDASSLLVSKSQKQLDKLPSVVSCSSQAALPWVANSSEFPDGQKDEHGEQVDLRKRNSWTYNLDEVPLQELLQVFFLCLS